MDVPTQSPDEMIIPQRFQTWLNAPEVFDDKDRRQIDLFNLVFRWGTIFLLTKKPLPLVVEQEKVLPV
jgi:hypothetical protein